MKRFFLTLAALLFLAWFQVNAGWQGLPINAGEFKATWPSLTETYLAKGQSIHLQYGNWQRATLMFLDNAYTVNVMLPVQWTTTPTAESAETGRLEDGWPTYKIPGASIQGLTPAILEKLEKQLGDLGLKPQKDAETMLFQDGSVASSIRYLKFDLPLKKSADLGAMLDLYFSEVPRDKAIELHHNTNMGASIQTNRPK